MTNKEAIIKVLRVHPCLTCTEIKNFAFRMFNVSMSPQSVAGSLRPMVDRGMVGKSPDPNSGRMAYWLTTFGSENLK